MLYKDFSKRAIELQDEIEKAIIQMMKGNGIGLISLYSNGNNSDFDVDKSYVSVENLGGDITSKVTSEEIIAVGLMDDVLVVLPMNADVSEETINTLEDKIIFKFEDDEENGAMMDMFSNENYSFLAIDETFTPLDTLLGLVATIEETIDIFSQK